ncbi:alpha/beta hydrolase [Candidatus Gottesmanbacteria bacterium]|nr:alpha/beta hydrolase [Candidatus Gottesmanbacteria bacterium]
MGETGWITNRFGEKMEALVRKPRGSGPFPAVVFVPGLGMTMHEYKGSFDELAGRLNDIGILTLQFQFDIFKPGGVVRELPFEERAKQFEDALDWLFVRSDVDIKRVGVLAQSYGVPTVLNLKRSHPALRQAQGKPQGVTLIKSFVFVSGAYFPEKSIRRVYEERGVMINLEGDTTLPRSSGERTTVGKEFWKDIKTFDDIGYAKGLRLPVFMIHGDQDSKIPISDAHRVFDAISSKQKKIKIFAGGDHGIVDVPRPMREEFLGDIVDWFEETL